MVCAAAQTPELHCSGSSIPSHTPQVRYCALLCATVRYCALTSAPKPCMWYFIPSLLLLQLVIDSLQRHGRQLRVAGGDRV